MIKKCKDIDILDINQIRPWVSDCCNRHKKRYDFRGLFRKFGMSKDEYKKMIVEHSFRENQQMQKVIDSICTECITQISQRELRINSPNIKEKLDSTTGKIRLIANECALHQIFDYIAVYGAMEIFQKRLVKEQFSSIKNGGQVHGAFRIRKWIRKNKCSSVYALKHKRFYNDRCKYFVKLDLHKCFPSADKKRFLDLFLNECSNQDLCWLWTALLQYHNIDDYYGFLIGALPSQWACQYMLSYAYRYAKSLHYKHGAKSLQSVTHMALFMDDILMIGSNRKELKKAVDSTIKYIHDFLGWNVKSNWHIRELSKFPIDMMGFVIYKDGHMILRARNFIRSRRMALRCYALKKINITRARRICSYKGYYIDKKSKLVTNSETVINTYNFRTLFKRAEKAISKFDKRKKRIKG